MARKKSKKLSTKKITDYLLPTMAIISLLFMISTFTDAFTIVSERVAVPNYLSGECVPRSDNLNLRVLDENPDEKFYQCTTTGAGTWVPLKDGIECEFTIERSNTFVKAYVCNKIISQKSLLESQCTEVQPKLNTQSYSVPAGGVFYVDSNKILGLFGSTQIKAKYPSYGLKITQSDGFINPTTTTCELNSLTREFHTIGLENVKVVKPGLPFNVVSSKSYVENTNQLVRLNDIENGKTIYISRPGYYMKVERADDGFLFVDTRQEFREPKIQCIPRTTGCSDDAEIINIEQQKCDANSGTPVGYSPVEGRSDTLCIYQCKDGKVSLTTDCIVVPTSCPSDKPLFDNVKGECVERLVPPEEARTPIPILWILIAMGIFFVSVTGIIVSRNKKDKFGL